MTHAEHSLQGPRLPGGCAPGGVSGQEPRKAALKVRAWWACFGDSDPMAVQGQQEDRARSPHSCLGKGLRHPGGFQSGLCHQRHLFGAFLEKQKQEQRPKPASLLPGPPSVSLAVVCLSILSACKLGMLEGKTLLPA